MFTWHDYVMFTSCSHGIVHENLGQNVVYTRVYMQVSVPILFVPFVYYLDCTLCIVQFQRFLSQCAYSMLRHSNISIAQEVAISASKQGVCTVLKYS